MNKRPLYSKSSNVVHHLEKRFITLEAQKMMCALFPDETSADVGIPERVEDLIGFSIQKHIFANGIRDVDGLIPIYLHFTDSRGFVDECFASVLMKPRDIEVGQDQSVYIGWGVAVLLKEEMEHIINLPEDERDSRLVSLIGLGREESSWWTKPSEG